MACGNGCEDCKCVHPEEEVRTFLDGWVGDEDDFEIGEACGLEPEVCESCQ